MRVAIDEAGRDPGTAKSDDLFCAKARKLGALADSNDFSLGDSDRAIIDQAERIAGPLLERRDPAVNQEPVPHGVALGEHYC
jgi:serine/threonine protein kinase HipA of HipAB toxin-antitoxin module